MFCCEGWNSWTHFVGKYIPEGFWMSQLCWQDSLLQSVLPGKVEQSGYWDLRVVGSIESSQQAWSLVASLKISADLKALESFLKVSNVLHQTVRYVSLWSIAIIYGVSACEILRFAGNRLGKTVSRFCYQAFSVHIEDHTVSAWANFWIVASGDTNATACILRCYYNNTHHVDMCKMLFPRTPHRFLQPWKYLEATLNCQQKSSDRHYLSLRITNDCWHTPSSNFNPNSFGDKVFAVSNQNNNMLTHSMMQHVCTPTTAKFLCV